GRPPARPLPIPLWFVRLLCRMVDLVGRGPLSSTALAQLEYGNAGQKTGFAETIGFEPASLAQRLQQRPSQTQDLWHARLYLLRPLVRTVLVLLWMVSGLLGLVNLQSFAVPLLITAGLSLATA